MEKGEVQKYVSETLMDKKIESNQVYPISAQNAYLANRAKRTIELNGKLPHFEHEGWVADFGKLALGTRWAKKVDDIEEVIECANGLWDDSYFSEPLKGMVEKAHSTAAENSIKSVIPKLLNYHKKLNDYSEIEKKSFCKEKNDIDNLISNLGKCSKNIENVKKEIINFVDTETKKLVEVLDKTTEKNQKEIKEEIDFFFQNGKLRKKSKLPFQEELTNIANAIFGFLPKKEPFKKLEIKTIENNKETLIFNPEEKIQQFKKEYEADELINNIQNVIIDIIKSWTHESNKILSEIYSSVAGDITHATNKKANKILDDAKKLFADNDFEINFSLPDFKLSFNFDNDSLVIEGTGKSVEKIRRSYVSNRLLNLFNDNWGITYYSKKEYKVDILEVKQGAITKLEELSNNNKEIVKKFLEDNLGIYIENYIDELTKHFERYSEQLERSKKNLQLAQEDKKIFIEEIDKLIYKNKVQTYGIDDIKFKLGV
jgi:hypothetical protein